MWLLFLSISLLVKLILLYVVYTIDALSEDLLYVASGIKFRHLDKKEAAFWIDLSVQGN